MSRRTQFNTTEMKVRSVMEKEKEEEEKEEEEEEEIEGRRVPAVCSAAPLQPIAVAALILDTS